MINFQWKSSDQKMMEENILIKYWPQNGIAFITNFKILIEHEWNCRLFVEGKESKFNSYCKS